MENPSPSSTAVAVILLLLILTPTAADVSYTASSIEITFALEALRNHEYNLFANAISTSDLQYQLLTAISSGDDDDDPVSAAFTLFAPKDDSLFALDMATEAPVYVDALRYHSVPNRRLTFADLQNLSSPILDTLLPRYAVFVGRTVDGDVFENAVVGVMVDGIRVSDPDLFLGSRIAVHGIDGILLTGLNLHQEFGGAAPVESPAPGPDRSDWAPAPAPNFGPRSVPGAPDGNIPAAAPTKMMEKLKRS